MKCYSLVWTLLLVYTNCLKLHEAKFVINYRITNHHMCLSSDSVLYTITGVSVRQCVEECVSLSDCSAVNYKRRYKFCELHSNLHENFAILSNGFCTYVKRSDIHNAESYTDECQNSEKEDLNKHNKCSPKFCSDLELKNGLIRGNMKGVGSRVEISCRKYFKESCGMTHAFCQSNGIWTHYPACTPSFIYIGCFEDKPDRILNERDIRPSLLTTEMCVTLCFEFEFKYALTEAGYACFCGNSLRNYPEKPEDECNTPCQGNSSQMCGGIWRGSLYKHI